MQRVACIGVGLAVVLVGGIVFTQWSRRPPVPPPSVVQGLPLAPEAAAPVLEPELVEPAAPSMAAAPRPAGVPTDPAVPTSTVELLAQDLAALRAKVVRLTTQVAALQQQMQAQQRTAARSNTDEVPPEARRDFASRAAEEQARHHQIAMLEASFQREPANRRWAAEAADAVQAALGNDPIIQNTLLALECRSTTCRAELADDDTGELGKALPLILQQLAPTLPSVTADTVDHGTRGRTLVLYLGPQVPESSAVPR